MAVYTVLNTDDTAHWLRAHYGYRLERLTATTTGIENSNYFLDGHDAAGARSPRVLTVFESVAQEDIPWFANLLAHLGRAGLPVPAPYPTASGDVVASIGHKRCVVVPRLSGGHIRHPNPAQCHAVGTMLARLHIAGCEFVPPRENPLGHAWRHSSLERLRPFLTLDDEQLITQLLARWRALEQQHALPAGIVHGDLFHDNALFSGDTLTGVIDFYYACSDTWLYDIAIVINDWCNDDRGHPDPARYQALLGGYQSVRALERRERGLIDGWLVFAALQFWLLRLLKKHVTACDSPTLKNPDDMRTLLAIRLKHTAFN